MGNIIKLGIQGPPGVGSAPFMWRLNPASVAQFGVARSGSANLPTVTSMVAVDGRSFVRFASTSDNVPKMVPLLDGAALLVASGRFRIEMRARWNAGLGAGQYPGIAFNVDRVGSLLTCYAVCGRGADGAKFDSVTSGVASGQIVDNAAVYDPAIDWVPLYVDVWLDTATSRCSYAYGPVPDSLGLGVGVQKRQVALATAAGTGIALYTFGGVGNLDVAELTVWKYPGSW